jgi:tryptophan synthase alpha chain
MKNRIQTAFEKNKIFAGYITVGDGDSLAIANTLIDAGVNLLELGVPFSDPIADGPVIQRAAERALKKNTSLFDVLALAKELRKTSDIPLVLFSYFNPLLHAHPATWLPIAKQAGIDGVLVVDLPYEEGQLFYQQCLAHDILPITIITPATTSARLKKITRHAKGFLYYASQKGTTGMRSGVATEFAEKIAAIKAVSSLPILAGFGIATRADAQEMLQHAEGFVVGSFFMKALEEGASLEALQHMAHSFISTE